MAMVVGAVLRVGGFCDEWLRLMVHWVVFLVYQGGAPVPDQSEVGCTQSWGGD